jgi:predicted glycogen debranching enzyme
MLEWVLPCATGGYSCSTIAFANTRRQHGFLVSSKVGERHLLVPKLEESLKSGEGEFSLSSNQYPGAIHPDGHSRLFAFSTLPLPTFQYQCGAIMVEKTIFPLGKRNAFGIRYAVFSDSPFEMQLRPMLCFRKSNELAIGTPDYAVVPGDGGKSICAEGNSLSATIFSDSCTFEPNPVWHNDIIYPRDSERQNACQENYHSPGIFRISLPASAEFFVAACEGSPDGLDAKAEFSSSLARANGILASASRLGGGKAPDPLLRELARAADSFVAMPDGKAAIIAGYPWFGEWGRDAMISLPGLLLSTGRLSEARQVLERFAGKISDGQLPNFIGEGGEPVYNSADASLWFIHSAAKYMEASGDASFLTGIFLPSAKEIVEGYCQGTKNGIALDADSLLIAGKEGSNLTWMDVKFPDGACATPRWGKPVEINALWYNALKTCEVLFRRLDYKFSEKCGRLSIKCALSFGKFWNEEKQCLYDTIDPISDKVRSNQIYAVSLPNSPLLQHESFLVLRKVSSELLTPAGLRTLSPHDPDYRGNYSGSMRERDYAYHNGCIWPFLTGAFVDAKLKLDFDRRACRTLLLNFARQMESYGVGSLPEIYESETLRPDGCIAQAWSVAEVLRAYMMVK